LLEIYTSSSDEGVGTDDGNGGARFNDSNGGIRALLVVMEVISAPTTIDTLAMAEW